MIAVPWHRPPRFQPPEPNVVRLIPPPEPAELPEPDLRFSVLRDHETLALEAAARLTPLGAYWAALTWGGASFAVSWSAWVRQRHQREWLTYLDEHARP